MTVLEEIQRLQFTDVEAAQTHLRTFVQDVFALDVEQVTLRPLAVSLNSFNGFLKLADGGSLFFKSHVEPGGVIAEYYNSDLLLNAGYPVIRPTYASTEPGRQMLLYEIIEDRSVFDVAWAIEQGDQNSADELPILRAAQHTGDDNLWQIYQDTLRWQKASNHADAPIHQLFYHRLTRGRLDAFYGANITITLPTLGTVPLNQVRQAHWTVNGVPFQVTLDGVIMRAMDLLQPDQDGPAIVGHGDAHNGNVFLRRAMASQGASLLYFDPAFAGQHDPLLDLVKPIYHNVFAMWMYFPGELDKKQGATLNVTDSGRFEVRYPHDLAPVRKLFWESKTERVLIPLLRSLRSKDWLRPDWRAYLQSALACCPLLTMNLADAARFPPSIALVGLAHTIEMGSQANRPQHSRVERWLDEVETAL